MVYVFVATLHIIFFFHFLDFSDRCGVVSFSLRKGVRGRGRGRERERGERREDGDGENRAGENAGVGEERERQREGEREKQKCVGGGGCVIQKYTSRKQEQKIDLSMFYQIL